MQTKSITKSANNNETEATAAGCSPKLAWILVLSVVALTIIAYSPVLFNFFLGDDFVHLTWLKDAVKNPELVVRNFHSSWLDGTTTRFYRPLISVFMVSDYMVWGTNGLGFHLTNLFFHLTATVFIFFIASNLLAQSRPKDHTPGPGNWLYPLGASLIFGLHPLHPEAVSWITGRVDAVVTAFYTGALYSYLRWRQGGSRLWFAGIVSGLTLGLLSKEMALTLPPAFILYELFLGPNAFFRQGGFLPKNLWAWAINIVKPTTFFWLMLVVYFGVRRLALGTFVGGYDDSLFFVADVKHFLLSWLHGLRMFLIPLNKNLIDAHNPLTKFWEITLSLSAVWAVVNVARDRNLLRLLGFNLIFLALCFAPVYKIFAIGDDLQGARLAHVATVAFSLLLAMAFIVPSKLKEKAPGLKSALIAATICFAFAGASLMALYTNNLAWQRAGNESNAIRQGLSRLYAKTPGDPQVLLLGLPDQIDGSYICRNAVWGMTKFPQLERDAWNCLMLDKYEQITPFGFLRDSLYQARDQVKLFFWNSEKKDFDALAIERSELGPAKFSGAQLKNIVDIKKGEGNWQSDGSLIIKGDASRTGRPELELKLGTRPSFDIEFVAVHINDLDTEGGSNSKQFQASEGADLLYTNDVRPDFFLPNRTHAEFKPDTREQTLLFPLRNLPEYSLGGNSHAFLLKLPHSSNLAISSIETVTAETVMPKIDFQNAGFLGTKGYLHLSQKDNKAKLSIDATRVPGAASVVLEITRPSLLFESQNCIKPSKVSMKELPGTRSGEITLTRDLFPATGMYEARAWAVDAKGNKIGCAGDHIVISVDS